MRMKLIVLGLALFALLGAAGNAAAAAAGSITTTTSGTTYARYEIAWTSSAGGAVSGNTLTIRKGHVVQVEFVPASGGTQPTDLYDIVLNDTYGVDVLAGAGANLSNAAGKIVDPTVQVYYDANAALDLVVANAGNAKAGTVIVWMGP